MHINVTMSGFQRMVGRRRWKASAAPSLVMTQSSLSQSMMVRSKSNTTTTAGVGADAMGGGWQGGGGQAGLPGSPRFLFHCRIRLLSSALYRSIICLAGLLTC